MNAAWPLLFAALAAAAVACSGAPAPPAAPAPAGDPRPVRGVVVVCIDALRWDRLGAAGDARGLTPNLDRIARESVVFTEATSPAPWTLPSQMSVFTGRWPTRHGVTNRLRGDEAAGTTTADLPADIPTFPELLAGRGWRLGGFTGGAGVAGVYGFSRGFEVWRDDVAFGGFEQRIPEAEAWLDAVGEDPFLLFLHGYDVHGAHALGAEVRERVRPAGVAWAGTPAAHEALREETLRQGEGAARSVGAALPRGTGAYLSALYDEKVRAADARLGGFLGRLREAGVLDRVALVVYADHGEELLDHGGIDHGLTLYQEQVHVPLMVRLPGGAGARRVDAPVSTIDLFPTLLELAGLPGAEAVDGRSLAPALRGEAPAGAPVFAETDYRMYARKRMWRVGADKLVLDLGTGRAELFDLAADPGEQRDLATVRSREAYELEQELRAHIGRLGADTNPFALP